MTLCTDGRGTDTCDYGLCHSCDVHIYTRIKRDVGVQTYAQRLRYTILQHSDYVVSQRNNRVFGEGTSPDPLKMIYRHDRRCSAAVAAIVKTGALRIYYFCFSLSLGRRRRRRGCV